MKARLTFQEEILGMSPSNQDICDKFIASKAPDAPSREEEIAAIGVDAVVDKGKTIFPRLPDGTPFVWDYQIKGMLKDICGSLRRAEGTLSSKLTAYKKVIDGLIFVKPRKIPFLSVGEAGECQRIIRINDSAGERTAFAVSETLPAGSSIEFEFVFWEQLSKEEKSKKISIRDLLEEWLNYGALRGWGQWRNSGKGVFTWEELK